MYGVVTYQLGQGQHASRLLYSQSLHAWLLVQAQDSTSPDFGSYSPQQWSPGQQWTPSPAGKAGVSAQLYTNLLVWYTVESHVSRVSGVKVLLHVSIFAYPIYQVFLVNQR